MYERWPRVNEERNGGGPVRDKCTIVRLPFGDTTCIYIYIKYIVHINTYNESYRSCNTGSRAPRLNSLYIILYDLNNDSIIRVCVCVCCKRLPVQNGFEETRST